MKRRFCLLFAVLLAAVFVSCTCRANVPKELSSMSFSLTENGTAFTADAARDGENVTVTVTSPAEIAGTSLTFGKDGREAGFGGVTVPLPEGCADVLYLITRVMSPSVELRTVSGGGETVTYETGSGTLEVKYNRDGIPLTVTVGDVTADVTAAK